MLLNYWIAGKQFARCPRTTEQLVMMLKAIKPVQYEIKDYNIKTKAWEVLQS